MDNNCSLFNKIQIIPQSAAIEYDKKINEIINYVNDKLIRRVDINDLVGEDGIEMMKINHVNHGYFMATLFMINRCDVLEKTLPWIYRAYHNQGFKYEYFLIEMEAWIGGIKKYLLDKSAENIIDAYRNMIIHHETIISLSNATIPITAPVEETWKNTYEEFRILLISGDTYSCLRVAENMCKTKEDVINFYLNVVQPALYNIGYLWETGKITVAQEHLATAIIFHIMSHAGFAFKKSEKLKKRAVVMSIYGDLHTIGAWMVANTLEFEGWDVNFLGDTIPLRDTMRHLAAFKPDILALSVTMISNIRNMIELIRIIKTDGSMNNMKILAGGSAFSLLPDVPQKIGADGIVTNCKEAALWGMNIL
jgi:methanogenic corrinoid protein MtbC1